MSDPVHYQNAVTPNTIRHTRERVEASLKRRYSSEKRFRVYGLLAVLLGLSFLAFFFLSIIHNGYTAFQQSFIYLEIEFAVEELDPDGTRDLDTLSRADYGAIVRNSLRALFPEVTKRRDRRALNKILSTGASFQLRDMVMSDPELIGTTVSIWLPADDEVDMLIKGNVDRSIEERSRRLKDNQIAWVDALVEQGRVDKRFNTTFFTSGDSREPELAGIWSATVGSFFMLLVTLVLAFPIGVAAASPRSETLTPGHRQRGPSSSHPPGVTTTLPPGP